MRLQLLGTGAAGGVPLYGCTCPVCQAAATDDRLCRKPCCAFLEHRGETILIDAGLADVGRCLPSGDLTRILLTHYHPDHVQGLFDLRWGCNTTIPVHGPDDVEGCADLFKNPGILDFSTVMKPFHTVIFAGLKVTPVPLNHSRMTLGYCFAHDTSRLAYLCDTVGLPLFSLDFLEAWQPNHIVLDCCHPPQITPPINHNDITKAIGIAHDFPQSSLWLTHISHGLDLWLQKHAHTLPSNIRVASDGLVIR
ncbi:MAG: phosphonate metabolism protein PhnP [Desulfobulbaceae bacterium]|nr:MAG: phosphonate metabolism protein PhnP [Desulfobulbaceae bacterium]